MSTSYLTGEGTARLSANVNKCATETPKRSSNHGAVSSQLEITSKTIAGLQAAINELEQRLCCVVLPVPAIDNNTKEIDTLPSVSNVEESLIRMQDQINYTRNQVDSLLAHLRL